tara:strand:- start:326 stop:577 length:252 start_codon:yes stop_codon:yes gene_type:complete
MPIYDYYCGDCGTKFSVFVSMNDKIEECEKCTSSNVVRVIDGLGSAIKEENYHRKTGDVVKKHIEEAKKDLRDEKEFLKKEVK